jgi:hypothetical protein
MTDKALQELNLCLHGGCRGRSKIRSSASRQQEHGLEDYPVKDPTAVINRQRKERNILLIQPKLI